MLAIELDIIGDPVMVAELTVLVSTKRVVRLNLETKASGEVYYALSVYHAEANGVREAYVPLHGEVGM